MASASDVFFIEKRVFPAATPRTNTHAVKNPDSDRLVVAANIYRPKSNLEPKTGDVTIVTAHANGFGKVHLFSFYVCACHTYQTSGRNCMRLSLSIS